MLANLILIHVQLKIPSVDERNRSNPAVRLKGRSAWLPAAFGHPSLALGQTALAVHDKAFGTNMRASWPLPPASLPTQWTRLAGAEL
jgi:hypothetical protein